MKKQVSQIMRMNIDVANELLADALGSIFHYEQKFGRTKESESNADALRVMKDELLSIDWDRVADPDAYIHDFFEKVKSYDMWEKVYGERVMPK